MASLEPHGEKLASLRRDLGYTQLELALRVGISERTVRNAERGRPINRDFLTYLAAGLGVTLAEVVIPPLELQRQQRWEKNVATTMAGIQRAMAEQDPGMMLEVAHHDCEMHFLGGVPGVDSVQTLMGDYHGWNGIHQFIENVRDFWEQRPGGAFTLEEPLGSGDVLLIRGTHELWQRDGGVAWGRFTYVVDYEDDRIRSVVTTMAPTPPPSGVQGMLTSQLSPAARRRKERAT